MMEPDHGVTYIPAVPMRHLEPNTMSDCQPLELPQHWSDVVATLCTYWTDCRHAIHHRVTVVKMSSDKRLDHCLGCVNIHYCCDWSQLSQLDLGGMANGKHL